MKGDFQVVPNIHPGIKQIVYHTRLVNFTRNDCVPYPDTWPPFYNGSRNTPCDMIQGPCACGAWHRLTEWIPMDLQQEVKGAQSQ